MKTQKSKQDASVAKYSSPIIAISAIAKSPARTKLKSILSGAAQDWIWYYSY